MPPSGLESPKPEFILNRAKRSEYVFANFDEYKTVQRRLYVDNLAPLIGDVGEDLTISFYVQESGVLSRQPSLSDPEKIIVDCIDEFIAFFELAVSAIAGKGIALDIPNTEHLLLRNIISDLLAIRILLGHGLSTPCLKICRPLQETVDVFILAQHDANFSEAFRRSVDPQQANSLWHQFVAKQKVVKAIKQRSPAYSAIVGTQFAHLAENLAPILGAAVHPSALVSFMSIARDATFTKDNREPEHGSSVSMLMFVAYTCWLALIFGIFADPLGRSSILKRMAIDAENYAERWGRTLVETFILIASASNNRSAVPNTAKARSGS